MAGSIGSVEEWSTSSGAVLENPAKKYEGSKVNLAFRSDDFVSMLGLEDLNQIRTSYRVPSEFDLELPEIMGRANNPPPIRLTMYEEAFNANFRLPIFSFILDLFRFYRISFCTLVPNSFRFIIGFLVACAMTNVRPSISLF